jgi:hypothetical protein
MGRPWEPFGLVVSINWGCMAGGGVLNWCLLAAMQGHAASHGVCLLWLLGLKLEQSAFC